MEKENELKVNEHLCLCNNKVFNISEDPELDMLKVLANKDMLDLVRGLSKGGMRSPFSEGYFGLSEKKITECMIALSKAGLVCSKREGDCHIYILNRIRFEDLSRYIKSLCE
jgi:hypothetical protein